MVDKKINLYDYLVKSANEALILQKKDGSMPAGHNGPYFDPETSVRNTSHWIITFLKAYEISRKKKFRSAAKKGVDYLLSKKARPLNASFWHRKNPEKDFCNGLIGQAWSIEALTYASDYFNNPEILKNAKEVFLMHPFNEKYNIWRRIEIDGTILSYDFTFNHQLWFAASGSLLAQKCNDKEIEGRIIKFMDSLQQILVLYDSGLIAHRLKINNIKHIINNAIYRFFTYIKSKDKIFFKEIGYHQFNLYAFALLKIFNPKHSFWKSPKFNSLWSFANSDVYINNIHNSKYGFPYNPPGIEMSFALEVFGERIPNKIKRQKKWLSEQFKHSFNFDTNLMEKNTKDSNTHAARIYEAVRLPEIKFTI